MAGWRPDAPTTLLISGVFADVRAHYTRSTCGNKVKGDAFAIWERRVMRPALLSEQ
jgi:hypothetical protein